MSAVLVHGGTSLVFWACMLAAMHEAQDGALWPEGPGRLRALLWACGAAAVFYAEVGL